MKMTLIISLMIQNNRSGNDERLRHWQKLVSFYIKKASKKYRSFQKKEICCRGENHTNLREFKIGGIFKINVYLHTGFKQREEDQ